VNFTDRTTGFAEEFIKKEKYGESILQVLGLSNQKKTYSKIGKTRGEAGLRGKSVLFVLDLGNYGLGKEFKFTKMEKRKKKDLLACH
jgi:hypothetical protein